MFIFNNECELEQNSNRTLCGDYFYVLVWDEYNIMNLSPK